MAALWYILAIGGILLAWTFAYALCAAASYGDKMICGHDKDMIVHTDEGTHYCSECEYEALRSVIK